ncbi:Undecaprenyl-phosphate galactose phosphotransferase [[Leptolyngbya] sp. PCC 7376]|uniref:sugar transferase n=1 Tax=[Leptolyngbya] sp. PCC 7376 TaxID=111781 RepID=UPI00029EEE72|nr:sugar transferase [[Leptolyngbya] sp. PCC 7376]AFY39656.1 Undecaprenyl-phosphate galactose phosphotransferase [[Leptolyngbya] sp. PCC 7376]
MTVYRQFDALKLLTALARQGSAIALPEAREYPNALQKLLNGAFAKRTFDICFSLGVLLFLSPLYLTLALIIKLSSPGPVFYVQRRVGKNYRPFGCIKFRTMVLNADLVLEDMLRRSPELRAEFEQDFKLKKDPRITAIGNFLRLTSLDEFPQFWNVLVGDMSIVGPRPLVPREIYKYGRHMDKVLTIRPGLTGLWQVSGRNDIPYATRVRMDSYYVHHRHWFMDLWIVCKTVFVMLVPKNNGAY